MKELQFSTSEHFEDAEAFFRYIAEFDPSLNLRAFTTTIPWPIMWSVLQRAAMEQGGLDVSEIGTTWVGSFASMNAVREFSEPDVVRLGGADAFLPSVWQSASLMDDDRILSIPWMTDTRLVFYWRDALEKARVDEQYAFDSPLQMEEALQRIVDSGQPALAIPTFGVTNAIHQLASWLWAMGGSFLSPDGRTAEFLSADSFAGICAYFRLHRFMARRYNSLDAVTDAFEAKNAAVTVNGPWFLKSMILRGATPQDLENLGVALPPGPPFLGGSNLVIWQRVKEESIDAALSWVAHLTSPSVQREVCNTTGLMPVLSDALNEPPYSTDAHYSVFKKAIERGQTLPRIARWGSLEEELVRAVGNIWSDLNEDPRLEVNATVRHYLTPVARHFDRVLNNK